MSVVLAGRTGCFVKPHVGVALGQVCGCLLKKCLFRKCLLKKCLFKKRLFKK